MPTINEDVPGNERRPSRVVETVENPHLRIARFCGIGTVLIGISGLLGWILGIPVLNSIIPGYKPIAISAAIIFVLLGGVLLLETRGRLHRTVNIVFLCITLIITLFGLLEIIHLLTGVNLTIEDAVLRQFPALDRNPLVDIAPVAGVLVFLIGLAQSLYLYQQVTGRSVRTLLNLTGALCSFSILISALFFLSYLYGTPFQYGTSFLPIAWPATLAAFLSSIGVAALIGDKALPFCWFTGTSTRARLLRAFLPLTALLLLLLSLTQFFFTRLTTINPAILAPTLIVVFETIIAVVVLQVARVMGDLIDRAELERQQAAEELRESEERLRATFDNAALGIVEVDSEDRFIAVNNRILQILGYSREELLGMTVHDLTAPEDRPSSDQLNAQLHAGRMDTFSYEKHYLKRDGTRLWVRVTVSAIHDQYGHHLRSIGTIEDISERKRAEEELQQLTASLEQRVRDRTAALEATNKELEAFSYSVSHDLRAPLRSIDGFSKILQEKYAEQIDAAGQNYLTRVRNAAVRMGRLIDDMLNLSRIGRQEMRCGSTNLSDLASSVISDLRQRDPERQVQVEIHPDLVVTGDTGLLRIVLENLLGNAWKFTSKTADARIEVGVMTVDSERVFYIRDNGAGFDMSYTDKLFTPFQRLHTEDEFPGTGIGLAIVQRIIAKHGGRIWAEGAEGIGATIYFTLGEECNSGL